MYIVGNLWGKYLKKGSKILRKYSRKIGGNGENKDKIAGKF